MQATRFTAFVGRRGMIDELLSGGLLIAHVGSVVCIAAGSNGHHSGLLLWWLLPAWLVLSCNSGKVWLHCEQLIWNWR